MDPEIKTALSLLEAEAASHYDDSRARRVTPSTAPGEMRRRIEKRYGSLDRGRPLGEISAEMLRLLRDWNVQITHPCYFGLFNPSVKPASVVADALVSLFNPNLAASAAAQGACMLERFVLEKFLALLGFPIEASEASFTSGGAEANHQALLVALAHHFPRSVDDGVAALEKRPLLYVSADAHGSIAKAAQTCGLGRASVRQVPVDGARRLEPAALEAAIVQDRARGFAPFFVVGTAGSTAAGAIDPLPAIAQIARRERLWMHVDAAWGGLALLSPRLAPLLEGIGSADSVTWDAHKTMSLALGAGMFFTRHREPVIRAFSVDAGYMPRDASGLGDAYARTLQWSRRFLGLRVFMTLATEGLEGLAADAERQTALGRALRARLASAGFTLLNESPLPVVCFTHPRIDANEVRGLDVLDRVLRGGRAWISHVKLGGRFALRACVTSYLAVEADLDVLVDELRAALEAVSR